MGSDFYLNEQFSILANYSTSNFPTSFSLTIYKCEDSNCSNCSYDSTHLLTGSQLCNDIKTNPDPIKPNTNALWAAIIALIIVVILQILIILGCCLCLCIKCKR